MVSPLIVAHHQCLNDVVFEVVVHDVLLASALDSTSAFAARRASEFALDALEGDAGFLTRTCDCRTHSQTRKAQKKALNQFLTGFGDEDQDEVSDSH